MLVSFGPSPGEKILFRRRTSTYKREVTQMAIAVSLYPSLR